MLAGIGVAVGWRQERIVMLFDAITLLLVTAAVPIVALVVFMSVAKTKRRRRPIQNFR